MNNDRQLASYLYYAGDKRTSVFSSTHASYHLGTVFRYHEPCKYQTDARALDLAACIEANKGLNRKTQRNPIFLLKTQMAVYIL